MRTTYMAKPGEVQRKWYIIDGEGKVLGRLAAEAAKILRGKHKPGFTPHVNTGDNVIVINADKIVLTGNKLQQKFLYRHSGYPGGLKAVRYDKLMQARPELAVYKAITGMLPHNSLGRDMARKLRVYKGTDHPHQAQQPEVWEM